jgi:hypothetical protein
MSPAAHLLVCHVISYFNLSGRGTHPGPADVESVRGRRVPAMAGVHRCGLRRRYFAVSSSAAAGLQRGTSEKTVVLAQWHRCYGAAMIYLKLRQAGELVNHKRVERLYALEKLQVPRWRRKRIPVSERSAANSPGSGQRSVVRGLCLRPYRLRSMLKCLVIVDDATREAIALIIEHCIGGEHLTRVLSGRSAPQRGWPAVIRTEDGLEFCGKAMLCRRAMLAWALCGSSNPASRTRMPRSKRKAPPSRTQFISRLPGWYWRRHERQGGTRPRLSCGRSSLYS